MRKRVVSFLMAALMTITLLPTTVFAGSTLSVQFSEVNPIYAGVIGRRTLLRQAAVYHSLGDGEVTYLVNSDEIAAAIRQELVERNDRFTVHIEAERELAQEDISTLFEAALEETGAPNEGDYLRFQYDWYSCGMSGYKDGGSYYYELTFHVGYFTTAQQEQAVTRRVREVLSDLNVEQNDSVVNTWNIYRYITAHTTYDYANLNDEGYMLKYTAYAALIDGTSVCQGYAVLLYRMLREAGIDCRAVTGIGNGGAHAWNIIGVNGSFYAADATWDAGRGLNWNYFLRTHENMADHTLDAEYAAEPFASAYPMGASDYGSGHVHEGGSCSFDKEEHWYSCDVCSLPIAKTVTVHTDNGHGVCAVCSYDYKNHVCRAGDSWLVEGDEHYRECMDCKREIPDTRGKHTFDGRQCTVCGILDPNHTCEPMEGDHYSYTDTKHYRVCDICHNRMTETGEYHEYDGQQCRVCGRERPEHTCQPGEWCSFAASQETGHYRVCVYCGGEVPGTRGTHTYAWGYCRDCGEKYPDHTCEAEAWYSSFSDGVNSGHYKLCKYCRGVIESTRGAHRAEDDTYYSTEKEHFQICMDCHGVIAETRGAHEYDGAYCAVCGERDPDHTCVAEGIYRRDEATGEHYLDCVGCGEEIPGTRAPHEYESGYCTVCGAADPNHIHAAWEGYYLQNENGHRRECWICEAPMGDDWETHIFNDNGICTVCGYARPGHTCEAEDCWLGYDGYHVKWCKYCGREMEKLRTEHNYVHGSCTVCGEAAPEHVHCYTYSVAGGRHVRVCLFCGEDIQFGEHTFDAGGICTVCGAIEQQRVNEITAVRLRTDENGKMHLILTAGGETIDATVTSFESTWSSSLLFENGVCAGVWNTGVIRTDKGMLEMVWAVYDDGRFLVKTMGGVTSNVITGTNLFHVQSEAYDMCDMVEAEIIFTNGAWVATGRLADGTRARLFLDETLENGTLAVGEPKCGDVNGDGAIDMLDLMLLRRYLAGGYNDAEFIAEAADLDGDGLVSMEDLILMRKYLAGGYGVTLGA